MRILVATDGSDPSGIGCELARDLATLSHGELRIIAVLPPTSDLFGGMWPAEAMIDPEPLERAACQQLEERLRQEVARTPVDLRPTSVIRRGRPALEIVAEAEAWNADLMVIGSRGHGPLSSILLGSVSEEVVDRSRIPVLVARRPRIRRLVVAVDASATADEAVSLLARDRTFAGLDAAVVQVGPPNWPWWLGVSAADTDSAEVVMELNETARREQQGAVDRAALTLEAAGVSTTCRLRAGDPADELVRAAIELDADVIVMGSHGRTGVSRLVLGSVARQVLRHAATSVLIVPAPAVRSPQVATPPAAGSEARSGTPIGAKETSMKILLAYDGGEPARRALAKAADIAKAMGGSIDVISVVPLHAGRAPIDPWDDRETHDEELREAHGSLAALGIATRLLEPIGDPAHTIESVAREGGYDMVVLGSRRQSVLGRMLQGSVSEHVATHADATVVIAR